MHSGGRRFDPDWLQYCCGWGQVQNGICTQVASVGSRLAPTLLSLTGGKCRTVFALRSRRLAPDWLHYCCGWGQVQNGMCTQVASVGSRLAPILLWLGASAERYLHSGRVGWLPTGSNIVVVGGKCRTVFALRSRRLAPDWLQHCCH